MTKKTEKETSKDICALDYAFQRIGGKYKGRLLWRLHLNNVMRYGELKRSLFNISTKMLTQTLRELEANGLVTRTIYNEIPPKVEYSLSPTGSDFIPFIEFFFLWGAKQLGYNYSVEEARDAISGNVVED